MAKLKQGESQKNQYGAYKTQGRYAKNKRAKLERHLKKYPNDEKAQAALKNISSEPKRKTPNTYVWSSSQREKAQLLARVGLNGHMVLNKKYEEKFKDNIIGYGSPHALDDPPKKKKGRKGGKEERKGV